MDWLLLTIPCLVLLSIVIYRVMQEHDKLRDILSEKLKEWVQPSIENDSYLVGDVVSYKGKTWHSMLNGNIWRPGVYGWWMLNE